MTKTYVVRERMVAARPRSKRLRKLGGATSTGTSSVSYSSWEGSGGGGSTFTLTITSPSSGVVAFNGTNVDFTHGHDWGDIVNKPNLVVGVTIGGNKISFLHANGDTVVASFSSINTRVADLEHWRTNPQGAAQAIEDLQEDVADLKTDKANVTERGMVIDPYVWAATYNPDGETWGNEVGCYWFDTTEGKLKICDSIVSGTPHFDLVLGMFVLWHEGTSELLLYSLYNALDTPTIKTITTS